MTVNVKIPVAVDVAGFPNAVGGLVGSNQIAVYEEAPGVAVNVTVLLLHEVEKVAVGNTTSLVITIDPVNEHVLTVLIAE